MKEKQESSGFIPREYDVFTGMDVDKKSIAITFINHEGERRSLKIPYNTEQLIRYINKHYSGQRVAFAYEAGPTGFSLYDEITEKGYFCLVASPSSIPTAPGNRVKTNRLDSKKIAENLRGGQLKGIHIPDQSYRDLRQLTQMRDTYVKQLVATKLRIKSLLLYAGIPFPETSSNSQWTSSVIKELQDLKCSGGTRIKLDQLILSLKFFTQNIVDLTKAIRKFCDSDDEIKQNIEYIKSIPGIGYITASQLLARIGDWRKLERADQLGSFLGLVPREKSTGDDINKGSITKTGNGRLRSKLIQCAWSNIRRDSELKDFYDRMYVRHYGKFASKKAIVAVARKLTMRVYAVLTQQRKYEISYRKDSVSLLH